MVAKRQQGHNWVTGVVFAAALLVLLAATFSSAGLLVELSPDRSVSAELLTKFLVLRTLTGIFAAGLIAFIGYFRWRGRRGILLAACAAAWLILLLCRLYPDNLFGQPRKLWRAAIGEELLLSDYHPEPKLTIEHHEVLRAKFPVINIHAHFRRWYQHWTPEELRSIMRACNVERIIDLDGELGKRLQQAINAYAKPYPDDFIIFSTFWFPDGEIDWGYFHQQVKQLDEAKGMGARGIKIWKNIGLKTLDSDGNLITVNDPRLEELWSAAERLSFPILIHVGDPPAFFDPICGKNERFEELKANPDWSFYGPQYPPLQTVLNQFEDVVGRHPNATFILAHLGNRTDDLSMPAGMLDRHLNLRMDISARISELGRQPKTARAFIIKYQDRLLFGTDGNPDPSVYRTSFRFLETTDEYFDYPFWPAFNYGRWKIYGIGLPDEVLKKLYHDNAAAILGLPKLEAGKR